MGKIKWLFPLSLLSPLIFTIVSICCDARRAIRLIYLSSSLEGKKKNIILETV